MAVAYDCELVSSTSPFADWAILYKAPKILVMAPSTFCWVQGWIGAAQEVGLYADTSESESSSRALPQFVTERTDQV